MKLSLYVYCNLANKGPDGKPKSDMLGALAEDHLNDVFSNVAAMITMSISQNTIAVRGCLGDSIHTYIHVFMYCMYVYTVCMSYST